MIDFKGKVAVVTGAASGIGRGLAERFADEGMRLVLADVEAAPLETVASRLRSEGAQVEAQVVDVSSEAAVERLAVSAYDRFGGVNVLCNNAGIVPGGHFCPIWDYAVEDWTWALGVNLMGIVHGIRSFVPRMRAAKQWGHVVNTVSVSGLFSGADSSVYGVSKHAAMRATEALYASLAREGSPIGVTALCPGVVRTSIRNSERNRPDNLRPAEMPVAEAVETRAAAANVTAGGLEPAAVAEMVVAAIRDRQFYLVTGRAFDGAIRDRMKDILERRNPTPVDLLALSQSDIDAGN
jgi:NAD(P)-dependent dehydrogenase (short-subunit alcohol dehydrogenase family)